MTSPWKNVGREHTAPKGKQNGQSLLNSNLVSKVVDLVWRTCTSTQNHLKQQKIQCGHFCIWWINGHYKHTVCHTNIPAEFQGLCKGFATSHQRKTQYLRDLVICTKVISIVLTEIRLYISMVLTETQLKYQIRRCPYQCKLCSKLTGEKGHIVALQYTSEMSYL